MHIQRTARREIILTRGMDFSSADLHVLRVDYRPRQGRHVLQYAALADGQADFDCISLRKACDASDSARMLAPMLFLWSFVLVRMVILMYTHSEFL